jgi:hypothetical protein
MLAKLPATERHVERFRQALKLPPKAQQLLDAEAAHQAIRTELDAVGAENTCANSRLHEAGVGSFKPMILDEELALKATIGRLAKTRAELAASERKSRTEVDRLRAEYQADCHRLVGPTCQELTLAIDATLEHAQTLFALADEIRAEARSRGIDIDAHTLVGGGAQFSRIIDSVRGSIAKLTVARKS